MLAVTWPKAGITPGIATTVQEVNKQSSCVGCVSLQEDLGPILTCEGEMKKWGNASQSSEKNGASGKERGKGG